jgi:outer membrane protein assembly factor BamB
MKKIVAICIIFLFINLSGAYALDIRGNSFQSKVMGLEDSMCDGGLMDSAWPMFHHDVFHTGRSPYGKSGTGFVEKWKIDIGSWVKSSPAIDNNNTIYIGGGVSLWAIYTNGTMKWNYMTGADVSSSPAIANDGTIYVGSEDGYLYAIYPNGTKKWSLGIGSSWVYSSPVIDNSGIIYVAEVDGNVCAVYPNGTKKWDYVTDNLVYSSPVLDNNGIVYCGSHDGNMYAIYTGNGTLKWKFDTGDWCGGTGATIGDAGIIYFGSVDGFLYALYSNGTLKWRLPLGSNVLSSPALAEDGTIYVAAYKIVRGAYMYSISPEGAINWRHELDIEAMSASPVIDKYGIIYIGGWDGVFYAFNPDGTIRWKFQALDTIFPSAAIGEDGTIYFGSHSDTFTAYLYAIEPCDNNPPDKPSVDGPLKGSPGKELTYTVVSTDPDGDNISYYIDWGDFTNSGWTEYVSSGTPVSMSHTWQWWYTYTIQVGVKDEHGMESWVTLDVKISKNKILTTSLFLEFLEKFPLLERMLYLIK